MVKDFEAIVGAENVMTQEVDLHAYSYDAAVLPSQTPVVAVRPTTEEQLAQVVRACNEKGTPLTVRGAGTNLSGGTIPPKDGVVVLTGALNKILEINEEDLYAVCQPGVITAKFAAEVASRGLFYPPDPGSQAVSTMGGNVAENAGGLRGLKYGVTKNYLMGMDFFDVDGGLVTSGSRTVKCVTGYNLPGLMCSSEGTLGVFSKLIFKLVPPPQASQAMLAVYDDILDASRTVSAIIRNKITPCTLEIMDNVTIRTVEGFRSAGLPTDAAALLLIEVDGHPAQVREEAELVQKICKEEGVRSMELARDAAHKDKLWQARRDALPALANFRPTCVLEDATVPRSQIAPMVEALGRIIKEYNISIGTFGHAGDGNLHPTIMTDRRDKEEWKRVEAAIDAIFKQALALGGTLSGEHGIGLSKDKWMEDETSPATIAYCRKLKAALDPKNILNPGKMFWG
jgi:glycolate oxidase